MNEPTSLGADGLYSDPHIYDVLHTPGTAEEARALAKIYRDEAGRPLPRTTVLEPACGSGRLLRRFAAAGSKVTGYDRSERMVEYAHSRLPDAHLFVSEMGSHQNELEDSSIDLAINTINTLRHLESDDELQRHFTELARVLAPNGRYVVGISLCDYGSDEATEDQWHAARGTLSVRQIIQYLPPDAKTRSEQVLSHLRVERPRGEEQFDSRYILRSYDASQWQDQLKRSPLTCTGIFDLHGRPLGEANAHYSLYALALS